MKRILQVLAVSLLLCGPAISQTAEEQARMRQLAVQRATAELQRALTEAAVPAPIDITPKNPTNAVAATTNPPAAPPSTISERIAKWDDAVVGAVVVSLLTAGIVALKASLSPENFAAIRNWIPGVSALLGLLATMVTNWSPVWGPILGFAGKGLQSAIDAAWPDTKAALVQKKQAAKADIAMLDAKLIAKPPATTDTDLNARIVALESQLAETKAKAALSPQSTAATAPTV